MFDIIGYWGVLTLSLITPLVVLVWIFCGVSQGRIKELGGAPVPLFTAVDKFMDKPAVGVLVIGGCIFGVIMSFIWACGAILSVEGWRTFIGFHSNFAEMVSPVSGYLLTIVAFLIVYDIMLKGYVKVTKLVNKLEEKAE